MQKVNRIKALGVYGSKDNKKSTTTFIIENIAIDAGNLTEKNIEHILISHSHLDHILDLPFFIEKHFLSWEKPLNIYALKETIISIKENIFNDKIWPDFTKITLKNKKSAINFIEIKPFEELKINNLTITPIPTNHIIPTIGFKIDETLIASDTYYSETLKEEIKKVKNLIIETSFPDRLDDIAKITKHLTPKILNSMLDREINLYIYHLKPQFEEEIIKDLKKHKFTKNAIILKENDTIKG